MTVHEGAWVAERLNWNSQVMGMLTLAWIKYSGGCGIPKKTGSGSYSFCMELLVLGWNNLDDWGVRNDAWPGVWGEIPEIAWTRLWKEGGTLRLLY